MELDYIKEIGIVKQVADLLVELTGLDFDIIDPRTTPFYFPCALKNKKTAHCTNDAPDCNEIKEGTLDKLISFKEPHTFKCPASRTKTLTPLRLNGDVIGILCIGENGAYRLDKEKLNTVSGLLQRVINYVADNEWSTLKHFKGNALTHQQQILHKVIKYIQTNRNKNQISLKEAASDNGISYYYLSRLFKKEMKTSFVKYRTDVKMDMATKLLKDLGLSVSQVAYTCGFEDPSYFCKVFKTARKCSPGDFRRKMLSGHGKKLPKNSNSFH